MSSKSANASGANENNAQKQSWKVQATTFEECKEKRKDFCEQTMFCLFTTAQAFKLTITLFLLVKSALANQKKIRKIKETIAQDGTEEFPGIVVKVTPSEFF